MLREEEEKAKKKKRFDPFLKREKPTSTTTPTIDFNVLGNIGLRDFRPDAHRCPFHGLAWLQACLGKDVPAKVTAYMHVIPKVATKTKLFENTKQIVILAKVTEYVHM